MMSTSSFLIDSNSFITPSLNYYPFDMLPKFWEQLQAHIEKGSIFILDMVKREIEQGDDELSNWICNIKIPQLIDHRTKEILFNYAEVLNYIQDSSFYSDRALNKWSQPTIADPWLIATALTYNLTIVSFEQPAGNLNSANRSNNPKIPDICSAFNVKYTNLFHMMRQLSFKF
jgi:hypothetical protein